VTRRGAAWGLLATVGVVALLSLPGLHVPLGRDQGIFGTAGLMVDEGRVLYRDVFEVKQPLILLTYALIVKLAKVLGVGVVEVVNGFDQAFRLASMPVLYLLGARLLGRGAGLAAAGIFGVTSLSLFGGFWNVAQAETFAGPLLAAAFLAALIGSDRGRGAAPWIGAGAAAAAAALFTAPAALPALLVVLVPVVRALGRDVAWRRAGTSLLGAGAGAFLVAAPLVVYFVLNHAVMEFFDVQVGFNRHHTWRYPFEYVAAIQQAVFIVPWRCEPRGLIQTGAAAAAVILLVRGPTPLRWLAGWYGLAWVTVPVQGKLWLYHYALMAPPQALLMAWCFEVLARKASWRGLRAIGSALLGAVLALQILGLIERYGANAPGDLARFTGRMSAERYVALPRFQEEGGQHYRSRDLEAAAEALRRRARPGDGLMVFGLDQTLNLLAGLTPTTRYMYSYPLVAPIEGYAAERERRRAEFLHAMQASPPRFLVVPDGPIDEITGQSPAEQLAAFAAFREWALAHYVKWRDVGAYRIFELAEEKP